MTWFGLVSAWAALLMGALFGVNAYFQFATGVSGWIYVLVAALLILGGVRTLGAMSGGLRLLAGAWGFAAGVSIAPWVVGPVSPFVEDPNHYGVGFVALALQLLPFAGLALTVLHKETKKA